MYIHRKQFVIGSRQFLLNEKWQSEELAPKIWLSYCQELQVTKAKDQNGREWYILGLAVESLSEKLAPEKEIAKTNSDLVPSLTQSWVGRWILIGNGRVYLDASGLLGCFYGRDSEAQNWASSSAALLAQILFADDVPLADKRRLGYEMGLSWYPPPRSRFLGISRLLPSQTLNLSSGEIEPTSLMPEIHLDLNYEEVIGQIQQLLITTLQRLAPLTPDFWLGLTAGYDSRAILALCYAAEIPLKPFTRVAVRMSVADLVLPLKLSQECGYTHTFIHNPKQSYPERQKLADEHTGCHISKGDAKPLIKGIRDRLKGISIGGHGFEVAKSFASLPSLPSLPPNAQIGAEMIGALFQESKTSVATASLKEWLDWILAHPQENLNWRDRFYLEQRHTGWLSSKEQLYDLNDLNRFPILNSAYLYSLFLGIKEERRLNSEIQKDLIDRTAPKLNKYAFNPNDFHFKPWEIINYKGKYLPEYIWGNVSKKARWVLRGFGMGN